MTDRAQGSDEFVSEATEILEALGRDLLMLDGRRGLEVDPDLLNGIFRGAHSLKGVAGLFGQDRVASLAHGAEDLLDRLRLGKLEADDAVLDSLIEALDVLGALVREAAGSAETRDLSVRSEELATRLVALSGPEEQPEEDPLDRVGLDPSVRAVFTEYEEHRLRENVRKGQRLWRVRAAFGLDDFDHRLADLNARLKPVGEVVSTLPSSQPGDEAAIAFDLIFASRRDELEIRKAVEGTSATVEEIRVKPEPHGAARRGGAAAAAPQPVATVSALPVAPAAMVRTGPEATMRSPSQTVRVDIRRLDELMNAMGELLVIKGNLDRMAEVARQSAGAPRMWGQELSREARALGRRLEALQDGLLGARMVPLAQVFDKLARLVRRTARESGKEIELAVSGGEVELDKLIVEELSDPLMHIIRNAIDHGIEPPDRRVQKGKPRRGTVTLRAAQRGSHVVIEVTDDGAGIDEEGVREVAVRRGLLEVRQARETTGRDLLNLIFLPGFSTARSVTELSGRGVGLDVVKTNIANLSGLIDVRSERGIGTTFEITLPVTLAIIRALVVAVSGRTYAVPLSSVIEILSITPSEVRTIERREMLTVRDRTLPLVRLTRLFGHPDAGLHRSFAVVVGLAQDRVCLGVDELMGQQDIVIKSLGGRLSRVPGIAGATDLGNRRTVLVLDVGALIDEAVNPERHAEAL